MSGAETAMTVEAFFKGVTIPYPYLEESTFREAVTKFCQLGMLWCYLAEQLRGPRVKILDFQLG